MEPRAISLVAKYPRAVQDWDWFLMPVLGGVMQKINGYPIWFMGYRLGLFAARIVPNAPIGSVVYDAAIAKETLERFIAGNYEGLRLSLDAARPLLIAITALTPSPDGPTRNPDEKMS